MPRKKKEAEPVNPLGWMVTFSDLVTLLLTFFVLLISMSSMDVKSVQEAFGLFTEGSGVLEYTSQGSLEDIMTIIPDSSRATIHSLLENKRVKEEIFHFDDASYQRIVDLLDKDIKLKPVQDGIAIQLSNFILFDEGEADLRLENLPILHKIAAVLRSAHRYPVSIDGHTDGSAAEGGNTDFAWQLSLARAIRLLEYFTIDEGIAPDRFRVGGFGPTKKIHLGDTREEISKNRRIEIILYRAKFG